jgi:hypothetical protein
MPLEETAVKTLTTSFMSARAGDIVARLRTIPSPGDYLVHMSAFTLLPGVAPPTSSRAGGCRRSAAPSHVSGRLPTRVLARSAAQVSTFSGARQLQSKQMAGTRRADGCRSLVVNARRGGGYNDDTPTAAERVVAALPYLLPLLDGLRYGKFFFLEFPQAQLIFLPLQPLLQLYTTGASYLRIPGRALSTDC